METVSHLAGPTFTICGRTIQRCLICGAMIFDSLWDVDTEDDDFTEDAEGFEDLAFPFRRFVQFSVGIEPIQKVIVEDDGEHLPPDSCIELLE